MTALLLAGAVLLGGALVAPLLGRNGHRAAAAIGTQAVATALVLAALVPVWTGGGALEASLPLSYPVERVTLRVDALSAFFLAWSLPMTLLGTVYAWGYLRPSLEAGRDGGPHFALLNVVSLSFLLVYAVQHALVFLLGWELAAVAAWLLVIWDHRSQKTRFAGFNYLVSTHVGLLLLVAGFMFLHARTGSMDFSAFADWLARPSADRGTVVLLLGAAFALKSAFFPFHTWLPRAHAAAPAHVSALMSGVIHKAGLFAFLRFALVVGAPEEWIGWSVLAFGALSAVTGALYAASQRDLKRLLGYSSTENVGIAAMGFGLALLGTTWQVPALVALGLAGGLLHVLNHAVFKCLLFYAAGAVHRATHTVDTERLGGLLKALPTTGALFLVGALAIAGLPPLNGFTSEILVYAGLLDAAAPSATAHAALVGAAAVLAFVGAVSALAMVRAFGVTFLGTPRDPGIKARSDAAGSMVVAMGAHAGGAALLGVLPAAGLALVMPVVAGVPAASGGAAVVGDVLEPMAWAARGLAVGLVALGGLGLLATRRARSSVTWGCGYTAATPRMQYTGSSFAEPLLRLFAALLDRRERAVRDRRVFPAAHERYETHVADAVESRLFEVLGRGEHAFLQLAGSVSEEPRFAFAAGLAALVVGGALLSGGAR